MGGCREVVCKLRLKKKKKVGQNRRTEAIPDSKKGIIEVLREGVKWHI